jgi:hypothetical protein
MVHIRKFVRLPLLRNNIYNHDILKRATVYSLASNRTLLTVIASHATRNTQHAKRLSCNSNFRKPPNHLSSASFTCWVSAGSAILLDWIVAGLLAPVAEEISQMIVTGQEPVLQSGVVELLG